MAPFTPEHTGIKHQHLGHMLSLKVGGATRCRTEVVPSSHNLESTHRALRCKRRGDGARVTQGHSALVCSGRGRKTNKYGNNAEV